MRVCVATVFLQQKKQTIFFIKKKYLIKQISTYRSVVERFNRDRLFKVTTHCCDSRNPKSITDFQQKKTTVAITKIVCYSVVIWNVMSNLLNDERCMKLPASCNFVLRFNWQNIDESIDVSMINFDDHANDELYLHKH